MRILQFIDTLETGGAERMAVNYANALHQAGDFVALAVTRKEGSMRAELHPEVPYLFVQKKGTIDIPALFRVRSFCKECAIRPSTTNDAQLKLSARPATEQPPHPRTHRNNNSTQNQET